MIGENLGEEPVASPARVRFALEARRSRRPSDTYIAANEEPATTSWPGATLIGVFLISIALPLVGTTLRLDSSFVLAENRTLSSRPELRLDRALLAEYPAKYEAYFNDQFGFRKRLIHWLNVIKVVSLGVSPSKQVILGQNGWLFYGGPDLDYYRAIKPLTPKQLENWQGLLDSRRGWLAARGIPYLLVIVPTKSTMYPEYMPRMYDRLRAESRLDQLLSHMKTHSSLRILDLREPIRAAKSDGQVYYRTDTHWNNRGAYAGYTKIAEGLAEWFSEFKAITRSDLHEEEFSEGGRDLALMLAMSNYYRETYTDFRLTKPTLAHEVRVTAGRTMPPRKLLPGAPDIVYENPDRELPRAVVFRDSFATWLIPFLSEHFHRIVFSWQYTMERELVDREKPDVVIQEMLERVLMNDKLPSE